MDKTLGTEGAALFKEYVVKPGAGIVKSAAKGQFNAGDFALSGYTDAIKSELGNYKLDYATLMAQSRDTIEAAEKEKREKSYAIDVQIAKLRAEWDAKNKLNSTLQSAELAEYLDSLANRIKNLEEEKTNLNNQTVMESERIKKFQEEMLELQNVMAEQNSKLAQDELLKQLNQEAMSLFTLKTEEEETGELYATQIENLFLGKYDLGTSANKEKIRKARKKEYFKSEKNLVYVIVNTYKSIDETQDKMKKCEQARDNAQALFGQEAMRVCGDLQIAKVGAQYTEMLLSEIRMNASAEIQKWADMYRLPDYERDYTKFNLDDYVMTKKDLRMDLKSKISDTVGNSMKSFTGF